MDRLDGPANLMVVSDLDMTMVDHHVHDDHTSQLRFNALWESSYRHDSLLVFSTGRTVETYKWLKKRAPMLTPDIIITSVGTEIAYGESMVPDSGFEQFINQNWDRDIVMEETDKFPQLKYQSETQQRQYKVSFDVEKEKAEGVMKALSECLEKCGLDVKIIFSGGHALDVVPKRGGKGQALVYLLNKFGDGKQPRNTLVCGDSGNDAELFTVPDVYGVMVSNAMDELLQWHTENVKNSPKIIHATERCASGIIQAIGHFKLGPNLSPRDVMDFPEGSLSNTNPGHEIVKFYLFYERWRRADIANSGQHIPNLKAICYPSGVSINPSGQEQLLRDCIDELPKFYGDKKGKKFRIWVDRVTCAQIELGSWLVKFDKWELSDEGPKGCTVTVVLCTTESAPDRFVWMHMHQTWLTGFGATDQTYSWLF
ncbi:probable sucrose-phosphatase 1 [Papaver somniferum]|uniref:probable sucrose-phosphatase 1 n=1 Tax=Papaver somniferum TaxID=3469 RepID=UPI000E7047C4|nr:probable sucrose-phosphatase 1 [Papaver somniferum]XP_026405337.1 probable sucrose-phosphatase 1 [Papaver somniferum]XP_026405338.1 probable sucrose-phosphatase 1 [Papaver somniferum]XP_026405340.1 probable sucrose-phosphatase 1 [Papaver somniferum]XP_026405341.1 probable sucrose-phosphatase 1 [Papaver somniferum]XP_026405342.1 probable sucrose-phosphatase 1 [Papaver somniferum]XP_026405343.1 probable sucrose-phosphatase 1 [Papaver somniferum]XP_026405344.1 probable sucrose-phosphatase 1 